MSGFKYDKRKSDWGYEHMNRENLINTLDNATANAFDVYFELYTQYFEKEDKPEEALELILEYPGEIGDTKDKNPQNISRSDQSRIFGVFTELICSTASRLTQLNYTKQEYYKKLYETVFGSGSELFPQEKEEKVIALQILSERATAVPYWPIVKIEKVLKEEFDETVNKLRPQIREALCMLRRRFDNKFEMVSQLLRIADTITERRQQVIFWTVIVNEIRNNDRKQNDDKN